MDKKIIYITNVTYEDSDGFELGMSEDGDFVESYPASVSLGAIPIYNEAQLIEGNTYLVQQKKSPKTGQYSGKLNSCVLVGKEKSLGGDYSLLFEGSLGRFSLILKNPISRAQGIYYSIFQRKEGENNLINLSSISQIYLNSDGKLKQMTLPQEIIQIATL